MGGFFVGVEYPKTAFNRHIQAIYFVNHIKDP